MRLGSRWGVAALLCSLLLWPLALTAETNGTEARANFILEDISITGLQRISQGVVYQALALSVGDELDISRLQNAQKRLFATGLFDDLTLLRSGETLLVRVSERPSINSINFSGNELLPSDELEQSFADQGIRPGEILKRSTAEQIANEIERVYLSRGRYGTEVDLQISELGKNQVDINLEITEAPESLVLSIDFIGAEFFTKEQLLSNINSKELTPSTAIFASNRYAAFNLASDLENITTRYLNSGFAKVSIAEPAVSISPDRRFININVAINEGLLYKVSSVQLSGKLIMSEAEARSLLRIKANDSYNQQSIDASSSALENALGDLGYGFAQVQPRYEFDDDNSSVAINFVVDPQKRVYVRRILIRGNTSTTDSAIRRELVQLEASWYEGDKVRQSLNRLRRLKYISEANYELVPVSDDIVDLQFNLTQGGFGMISGGLTYSDLSGTALSFSYSAFSAFGSGNDWSISASFNETSKELSTSLYEPYFTLDGVSRRTSLNYRETDLSDDDEVSNYRSDTSGLRHSYGYPISRNSRVEGGLNYSQYRITLGDEPTLNISNYVERYGDNFDDAYWFVNLRRNTLNRGLQPNDGSLNSLNFSSSINNGANAYYRLDYNNETYFPFSEKTRELALRLESRVGYMNSYDSDEFPPFYRHYFLGLVNGVRGYSSLAPKATDADGEESSLSWGGNISLLQRFDMILPLFPNQPGIRTSLFYDIGNSYHNNCIVDSSWCEQAISYESLRQSYGFSLQWFTAIGPLGIIYAIPTNAEPDDNTRLFNFFIGQTLY